MKSLFACLMLLCCLSSQVMAKAYFQTKNEMIEKAEAIAIVEISSVQDSDTKGQHWTYRKKGTVTVEETLKGELPKEFTIYGAETFICASCPVTNGRFLVFLKKDGDLWTGSNWHLSLRPIKDGMIEWYIADDNRHEMKPTALKTVLTDIKTQTASEPEDESQKDVFLLVMTTEKDPLPVKNAKALYKSLTSGRSAEAIEKVNNFVGPNDKRRLLACLEVAKSPVVRLRIVEHLYRSPDAATLDPLLNFLDKDRFETVEGAEQQKARTEYLKSLVNLIRYLSGIPPYNIRFDDPSSLEVDLGRYIEAVRTQKVNFVTLVTSGPRPLSKSNAALLYESLRKDPDTFIMIDVWINPDDYTKLLACLAVANNMSVKLRLVDYLHGASYDVGVDTLLELLDRDRVLEPFGGGDYAFVKELYLQNLVGLIEKWSGVSSEGIVQLRNDRWRTEPSLGQYIEAVRKSREQKKPAVR